MYLTSATRPDIARSVNYFAQFLEKPQVRHCNLLKRVLRYLQATPTHCLWYPTTDNEMDLTGYADADWASGRTDRRSRTGYIFFLGKCCISWMSRRQPTVALSTTEAEYMAASHAAREAAWFRNLLTEMKIDISTPTVVFEDNQSTIKLTENPVNHARTKHIDVQHHFIREQVEGGKIKTIYCPTEEMISDALTKPLAAEAFRNQVFAMGVRAVPNMPET